MIFFLEILMIILGLKYSWCSWYTLSVSNALYEWDIELLKVKKNGEFVYFEFETINELQYDVIFWRYGSRSVECCRWVKLWKYAYMVLIYTCIWDFKTWITMFCVFLSCFQIVMMERYMGAQDISGEKSQQK